MSTAALTLTDEDRDRIARALADELRPAVVAAVSDGYLEARDAAAYLGVSVNALNKIAGLPCYQDGPGCKRFYRRSELDAWRQQTRVEPRP